MKEKVFASLYTIFMLALPLVSFAAPGLPPPPAPGLPTPPAYTPFQINIPNPLRSDINSIPKLIEVIITEILTPIAAVVVILMIMWAGFLFVTARGNTAQITKARDTILYGSIGAAILLGANLLAYAIKNTVDQLK